MSSIKRMLATLRLLLAEDKPFMVILSSSAYVACLLCALAIGAAQGFMQDFYARAPVIDVQAISTPLAIATVGSMLYLTTRYVGRWFKSSERATTLLTLPVRQSERFATLLVFAWVVVPVLSIVPPIAITLLAYALTPEYIVLPEIWSVLSNVPNYLLTHVGMSCLYLLPVIAQPKRFGFAVVLFWLVIIGYVYLSRSTLQSTVPDIELVDNPFEDKDVVGMYDHQVLTADTASATIPFSVPNESPDLPPFLLVAAGLALVAAAGVGLTERTV